MATERETLAQRIWRLCDACVAPENCARIGRCLATPPTPDLDAAREAFVNLLDGADMPFNAAALAKALGVTFEWSAQTLSHRRIADALLAHLQRQDTP